MKKKVVTTVLFINTLLMAFSQGFQVNLQGQKQQAMCATGTGLPQDAATLFFNPAGMNALNQNSVYASVTPVFASSVFEDANTKHSYSTTSPVTTPFAAYAVFGSDSSKGNRFKFGIGAYTPFGSIVKWESNWAGRFITNTMSLQAIFIQPTLSIKLHDKLSVGAGFVYSMGSFSIEKDIPVQDNQGNYGHAQLKAKASGYGANAGIYFAPVPGFSIGITYRSEIKMKADKGTATFTVPNSLSNYFPSGSFKASLPLPQVITAGVGVKAIKNLNIAFDINYIGWQSYDTLSFDYTQNTPKLPDTKEPRMYKNTFAYRLGVEYTPLHNLQLRCGAGFIQSPIQNGYVTPEIPDADKVPYTVGIGWSINSHLQLDASVVYERMIRVDQNKSNHLSGTYRTSILAPGLAISYKF